MKHKTSYQRSRKLVLALSLASAAVFAQTAGAQSSAWVSTKSAVLSSASAGFQALAASTAPVTVAVVLKLNNEAALDSLITAQRTPGNPSFQQWLTSAQSTQNFAPSAVQAQAVADYLTLNGFANVKIASNRLLVTASGTVAAAQRAFNTTIGAFSVNGKSGIAPMGAVQVPASLTQVNQVLGLDTLATPVKHLVPGWNFKTTVAGLGAGGSSGYYPDGFATVYNRPSGQTGRNTVAAIIGWGGMNNSVSDLQLFEAQRGIAAVPTSIVYDPASGSSTADQDEWSLDSQAIVGISGGVKQLIFYSPGDSATVATLLSTLNRAVSDNTAKVINMSWSWNPAPECGGPTNFFSSYDDVFKLGASQGQTFSASTGDNGSWPCSAPGNGYYGDKTKLAVAYPAISPYVIAIGGTTLSTGTNLAYGSESSWAYSGGGISTVEPKPAWQSGLPGAYRQIPDLAFDANPASGMVLYFNGGLYPYLIGGTSLASPLFVGAWAVLQSANNNALEFAPPMIYPNASQLYGLSVLHDVTSGINGYYSAVTGYDNATGLGSFDITKMSAALVQPTNYTVTASAGTGGTISPSGNVPVTSGQTKPFTLLPSSGYQVSTVGGTCGGSLSGNTYTTKAITANCTVIAAFTPATSYTVTASAGTGGVISPSGSVSVPAGTAQKFTITANTGYYITSFPVGGTCGGTLSFAGALPGGLPTSITYTTNPINANCTVTSTFSRYYVVTASGSPGGSISPTTPNPVYVPSGGTMIYTLKPNAGYKISSVGGTCKGILNGNAYNLTPTADCTVVPSFVSTTTPPSYTVTASAGTGGVISPSGSVSVPAGTAQKFTITANTGYYITSFPVGGTCGGTLSFAGALPGGLPTSITYTTNPINANCTVTSTFSRYYVVTARKTLIN